MMTHKTKRRTFGGALMLALTLAMPGAFAQDTPPAPPATTAPAATPQPDAAATTTGGGETVKATGGNHLRVGPEIGLFLPTSSKTRDRFGESWLSLGIGLGQVDQVTEKGQTSLDLNILYQSKGDNHALVAPIGAAYRIALGQGGANTPYAGVSADLVLAELSSPVDNVHRGLQTGAGGSVFIGENFGSTGFLEARYLAIGRIKGFDLSGLNFSAGYRF